MTFERRRELLATRPLRGAHHVKQDAPLIVAADADRNPRVVAARREGSVGRPCGIIVGRGGAGAAVEAELHEGVRDKRDARLELCDVDVAAAAGFARLADGGPRAERRHQAGVEVGYADAVEHHALVGVTAEAADARKRLADRGKRYIVAPEPVLPEARDRSQHDS